MVDLLDKHKEDILGNIVVEQGFRIGLNSVDPHIHVLHNLFGEVKQKIQS